MNFCLQEVTKSEKEILRNLVNLCMHDYSEFDKFEVGPEGEFSYRWFGTYFEEEGRYAYLIRVDGNLGGFVMVRSNPGDEDWDFQIAEFFILRRYRRMGLGSLVSQQILNSRRGLWEISYDVRNESASYLWSSISKMYTDAQLQVDYGEKGRNRFLIQTDVAQQCAEGDALQS
ncbi:MAG: GNAT family N-acetyltransferase [Flavobacteriaceae bacterium]